MPYGSSDISTKATVVVIKASTMLYGSIRRLVLPFRRVKQIQQLEKVEPAKFKIINFHLFYPKYNQDVVGWAVRRLQQFSIRYQVLFEAGQYRSPQPP